MLSSNLKILRKIKGLSQEEVAEKLGLKRTSISGYENGTSEPSVEGLIKFSKLYNISIDSLLCEDLSSKGQAYVEKLTSGNILDLEGKHLRVVATTVDRDNNENIELVPISARAGYVSGYADPDYIRVLPTFQLPFLSKNKKYRTFPIIGDSMPPVSEGSWVTGEYLQNWNFIKDGYPYIVITVDEGIVFKILYNRIAQNGSLLLCSTNPMYAPYELPIGQIKEVWKFVHFISGELPEPNLEKGELTNTVMQLQREVTLLKNKLNAS
ncbi:MAG: XRE family transcriptional regulator [Flavobacteriales bacterium]